MDIQKIYFTSVGYIYISGAARELCKKDEFAKTLYYCDVPKYYTWNNNQKIFQRRKQGNPTDCFPGIRASHVLGRVYTVHPNNGECVYLRMLLHIV